MNWSRCSQTLMGRRGTLKQRLDIK